MAGEEHAVLAKIVIAGKMFLFSTERANKRHYLLSE